MTPDRAIATAADYADALMTSRRAKNSLVLILILLVLVQLALFFLVRYNVVDLTPRAPASLADVTAAAATQPAEAAERVDWGDFLHYVVGGTAFLGVALSVVLSFVLMLILNIMLVGRLIGAGRLTSAYVWSILVIVIFFPWQAFLNHVQFSPDEANFKLPGVLYHWYELTDREMGARFPNEPLHVAILKWWRFVGYPLLGVLMLLVIQVKSNRGLKQALGEAEPVLETSTATTTTTRNL